MDINDALAEVRKLRTFMRGKYPPSPRRDEVCLALETVLAEVDRLREVVSPPPGIFDSQAAIVSVNMDGREFAESVVEIQISKMQGHRETLWAGMPNQLAKQIAGPTLVCRVCGKDSWHCGDCYPPALYSP